MKPITSAALTVAAFASAACYDFNVTDPNAPTTASIYGSPTRANMAVAATGIFDQSRQDVESYVWRLGSMGREGANLSGNNQPDYTEPYYGPLSPSEFGGSNWGFEYVQIRNVNLYLDAVPHAPDLSADEKNLSLAFGETEKALSFWYIIQTRAQLGAPVNVDIPATAAPAPFASEDSVYRAIIDLLADARTKALAGSAGSFPFNIPAGFANANTPATFAQFTQALSAKAWVFRATDATQCGGAAATCYANASALLDSLFTSGYASASPGDFQTGVSFDFSANPGDTQDGLSDPLNGIEYFALPEDTSGAQMQAGGTARDARALSKIAVTTDGQTVGTFPIIGNLKFTMYLTNGAATNYVSNGAANPAAPVPIIRNEELVLLRAEAKLGAGNINGAIDDINIVAQGSGNLPALAHGLSADATLTQLLYNRFYSLLWEQGTRWVDARRYGRLSSIQVEVPGGAVPSVMPVPSSECQARGLGTSCTPPTAP